MHCIRPIKASQAFDGTITYSQKSAIPGLVPMEFPCRKCLPCRLNIAREKAIRAYHEAQMHENNIFLTLTYDDEHLESPRLIKDHIVKFNKDLRDRIGYAPEKRIKIMYTGEYGGPPKILPNGKISEGYRPHWHSIIFNYRPKDAKVIRRALSTGENIFGSDTLKEIWQKGEIEFGSVTIDSASYVARYAAKKLIHGKDQDHDYHPIHQTPSSGLGKTWIEKHWKQTFDNGYVLLPNREKAAIPRYYVDWLKKHKPSEYIRYVTEIREKTMKLAEENARKEELDWLTSNMNYKGPNEPWLPAYRGNNHPLTRNQVKHRILNSKFKQLQEKLKL